MSDATMTNSVIRDLGPLFCPRSIAVVGASRKVGSVGHAVIRQLGFRANMRVSSIR